MVKILRTAQSAQWRSYLYRLPPGLQDIHFHPEMMMPYEKARLGEGMLAVVEQGNGFMIQPLLKMNDGIIRHPYNFGGPVALDGFEPTDAIFPSTFILNPFLHEHQNKLINQQAKHVKDTVWIDLTKPFDLRQTTRHMVEKADVAGVVVKPTLALIEEIETFCHMYNEYMASIGAAEYWRFPLVWFRVLLRALGNANSALLFAKQGKEIVGGCLLIHDHETCYYHFGFSNREPKGVAHRMVISAAEFARNEGYKRFHLGGGVEANDGLFMFKSGFSDLRLPIYKYECVK